MTLPGWRRDLNLTPTCSPDLQIKNLKTNLKNVFLFKNLKPDSSGGKIGIFPPLVWVGTAPGKELWKYQMAFPTVGGPHNCPVGGCPGRAATRMAMRVHFIYWHVRDTVFTLKEGNLTHPWFPLCNMLIPWHALNRSHLATNQSAREAKQNRKQMAEEELW